MRSLVRIAGVVSVLFFFVAVGSSSAAVPSIPGITAKDVFPGACVDCHVRQADGTDMRISTLMAKWNGKPDPKKLAAMQAIAPKGATLKGKHLPLAASVKNVPAACIKCHAAQPKLAPTFFAIMHVAHLSGGEQSRFVTQHQGACTHCHKLNKTMGTWSIPNGAEK